MLELRKDIRVTQCQKKVEHILLNGVFTKISPEFQTKDQNSNLIMRIVAKKKKKSTQIVQREIISLIFLIFTPDWLHKLNFVKNLIMY